MSVFEKDNRVIQFLNSRESLGQRELSGDSGTCLLFGGGLMGRSVSSAGSRSVTDTHANSYNSEGKT